MEQTQNTQIPTLLWVVLIGALLLMAANAFMLGSKASGNRWFISGLYLIDNETGRIWRRSGDVVEDRYVWIEEVVEGVSQPKALPEDIRKAVEERKAKNPFKSFRRSATRVPGKGLPLGNGSPAAPRIQIQPVPATPANEPAESVTE